MTKKYWMFAALPIFCAACAGSHAAQVQDTQMSRIEQRENHRIDNVEKKAAKRQDMVDKNFEAQKTAVSKSDAPSSERSEDMLDSAKDRSEYQVQARAQLDKLGVRIQAAEDKVKVLGAKVTIPVRQELQTVSTEQSSLQEQLAEMTEAAPANWDQNKSRMKDRINKLESRISDVTGDIDDSAS